MKTLLLLFFMATLCGAAIGQSSPKSVLLTDLAYLLPPDDDSVFLDSVFSDLRTTGLMVQVSEIAEKSPSRSLKYENSTFHYWVEVTQSFKDIALIFYSDFRANSVTQKESFAMAVREDFLSNTVFLKKQASILF